MTTPRTILLDGANTWNKMPYQVSLGSEFESMADALRYLADMEPTSNSKISNTKLTGTNLSDNTSLAEFFGLPTDTDYLSRPYFRDTRLGANDAINCIWQFNRDDDIVHPNTMSDSQRQIGMGRVYASTTEQNQTILWLSFGVPRFTSLTSFYLKAFHKDIIKINATGTEGGILSNIGNLFTSGVSLAISIVTAPVRWVYNIGNVVRDFSVDRFYDFRSTMHLYYKYVDSILATWLVDTGMYSDASNSNMSADPRALPIVLQEIGPSIWDVLATRARMLGMTSVNKGHYEDDLKKLLEKETMDYDMDSTNIWSWIGRTWDDGMKQTFAGATQYIGFRVEKDTDASESWSSSTAPSAIAEKINSTIQEAASKTQDYGLRNEDNFVKNAISGAASFLSGITNAFTISGITDAAMYGAYIDMPEQYKSSEFHKSHSVSFKLRSPYGDITSIYQSIIVPLACLMAAALPRAAGNNSWMQPFNVRAYCAGRFSVSIGIIESLSIRRGSSEFGWTYQNLPTCVDVSISIKDMATSMYMSIHDGWLPDLFPANDNFKEFMLTLSGTGLQERVSRVAQYRRHAQYAAHMFRNRILNPMYHTSWIRDTLLGTIVSNFLPMNLTPKN